MSPENIVRFCARRGIEMLAICDHDTADAVAPAIATGRRLGVRVLPAMEYSTDAGDVVGLLACPNPPSHELPDTLDAIHAAGGIAVVVHPGHHHDLKAFSAECIGIVECFNSRCSPAENAFARNLAVRWGKPVLAGADAHLPWELGLAINELRVPQGWSALGTKTDEIRRVLLSAERRLIHDSGHPASVRLSQAVKSIRSGRPMQAARASLSACREMAGKLKTRRGSRP